MSLYVPAWPRISLKLAILAALALAPAAVRGEESNTWSRVLAPSAGSPTPIGGVAHGCIAGAQPLPIDGPGYEVIRLSRKRYFGHPDTVAFVERLGRRAQQAGLPAFYVGDMAQPRGGPLPFGHASHQNGLDVDIWFTFARGPVLPASSRETIALPTMLAPSWKAVDPARFAARQMTLLRLAAMDPHVDRIFVNPVIKTAMCRAPGAGDWLRRLRPWWGHDDHFHVRLRCPANAPECEQQAEVPPGDGCDEVLASWVRDQRPPPDHPPPPPQRKLPVLPEACHALLGAPRAAISLP